MRCFQCDDAAAGECPRCGGLFCYAHGDVLCERCSDPARSLPSYRVYRGSLAALVIGAILAIWQLMSPSASERPAASMPNPVTAPASIAKDGPSPR
jgi:hypothetical protein